MNKKIIISVVSTLMIAGTTSFSAFATTPNGTVVIGNKSFDLAYANDTANITEITNLIVQGGAIYVKDFSGNWIDNNTGKIVDASVIPGEDGGQVEPSVVASVGVINITKNIDDIYTLPSTVTATLANLDTKELVVTWDKVADTKVAGEFTFTGILTMDNGVVNSNNVNVIAKLTVIKPVEQVVSYDKACAANSLVVKSLPGTSYGTLGTIKAGTTVEVYDGVPIGMDQGDWYSYQQYGWSKIKYENEYAWVKTDELEFDNPYNWVPGIKEKFENKMVEEGYALTKTSIQYKNAYAGDTGSGFYQVYTDLYGQNCVVTVNVKTGWYHG